MGTWETLWLNQIVKEFRALYISLPLSKENNILSRVTKFNSEHELKTGCYKDCSPHVVYGRSVHWVEKVARDGCELKIQHVLTFHCF